MASDPGPAISVLQLRIALRGLSPPVWRRVLVPEHLTPGQLHHVIQVVMGWADEHLHTFSIRGRRYGEAAPRDTDGAAYAAATSWPAAPLRGGMRALPARGHWRDREVS